MPALFVASTVLEAGNVNKKYRQLHLSLAPGRPPDARACVRPATTISTRNQRRQRTCRNSMLPRILRRASQTASRRSTRAAPQPNTRRLRPQRRIPVPSGERTGRSGRNQPRRPVTVSGRSRTPRGQPRPTTTCSGRRYRAANGWPGRVQTHSSGFDCATAYLLHPCSPCLRQQGVFSPSLACGPR
jgi:hypothetical protein